MLDFSEYNQLLAEKYEERVERHGQKVAIKFDWIPTTDVYITMDLMIQKLKEYYNATFEEIKKEMVSYVESFWMESDNCIIIRYWVFGDKLFQEIPKSAFFWPYELDAMLEVNKNAAMH